jgi:hypothetical protein
MLEYFGQLRQRLTPLVSEEQIDKTYQRLHALAKGNTLAVTDNSYEIHNYSVWVPNKITDTVIAADEFLTYADSEEEQIDNIKLLCQTTKKRLIVTVRDYKNEVERSDFDRPFMLEPLVLINEKTDWNRPDKQSWSHTTYVSNLVTESVKKTKTVSRRTLYFKQLAKFCYDFGCRDFQVLTGESFRPLFKKHFENIVLVEFSK